MLSDQELKEYVQRNDHLKNYMPKLIEHTGLSIRDNIFNAEYEMKTTDKRTKEYNELQKTIAWNQALIPQVKEAYKTLTGKEFPHRFEW
jgi:hypothetical protein